MCNSNKKVSEVVVTGYDAMHRKSMTPTGIVAQERLMAPVSVPESTEEYGKLYEHGFRVIWQRVRWDAIHSS